MDQALLEASQSFSDARLGISERFVRLELSAGGTWGVLSMPIGEPRTDGWVVCHAFGRESADIHMTDVGLARRLAASGYPTLRFHCMGYGDSDDVNTPAGPASHVRDTTDVVRQMPDVAGVSRVGVLGGRFGGTVAAMVADRQELPAMVLIAPVLSGSKYMTELLRSRVIADMVKARESQWLEGRAKASDSDPTSVITVEELRASLERDGMVNVKGFPLHRSVFEEMEKVNLLSDLSGFRAASLVIQVSRGDAVASQFTKLVRRLDQLGATTTFTVVSDPFAPHFGYEHFQAVEKDVLGDSLVGLNRGLADTTLQWISGLKSGPVPTGVDTGGER